MNITELSPSQLRKAAKIKEQVLELEKELSKLLGSSSAPVHGRCKMSAAARAKIAAAQRARWAKQKGVKVAAKAPAKRARRPMSAAAKKKIALAAKARWAKAKAAGKNSL